MKKIYIPEILGINIKKNFLNTLVISVMVVFIALPDLYAETIEAEKISIDLRDVRLRDVLRELKKQTNFDFIYNSKEVQNIQFDKLEIRSNNITEVMQACLKGTNYEIDIRDNIVIIRQKSQNSTKSQEKITVRGVVVNMDDEPLPGVNIISTVGPSTISDSKGKFVLNFGSIKDVALQFSFVGMKPQEVVLNGQTEIRVVMVELVESLDEVVVTGMEVVEKMKMTGAVETVKTKDLIGQGIASMDELLDGKIAGLNSSPVTGAVGVRSQITIRGENNLTGNTEPLWILDGLPMTGGVPKNVSGNYAGTIMQDGVGNVMPEDIASITILKDAAAAAIYGAKAANGVIVIETKKGFRSKTKFSYSGNFEYSFQPDFDANMMNSAEKLEYETGIVKDFGVQYADFAGRGGRLYRDLYNGYITRDQYLDRYVQLASTNTDWFGELFQPSRSMRHSLSVRGGTNTLSYYTSLNYSSQDGIVEQNSGSNVGFLSNLQFRPHKRLILNFSFSGNARENKNHASNINPFKYAAFANPYEKPYDENGDYADDLTYLPNNRTTLTSDGFKYRSFNILNEMNNTKRSMNGLDASATINVRYNVFDGFSIQSLFRQGYSFNTGMVEIYPETFTSFAGETFAKHVFNKTVMPLEYNDGSLNESAGRNNQWSMRNQINYSKGIGKNHLFSLLLANEVSSTRFNNFRYTAPKYDPEYRNIGVQEFPGVEYSKLEGKINNMMSTSDGQGRTVSFLGQLRYSFDDKYVASFSIRTDGADVIGDNNQFKPLWSVGGRWNIEKEKFWDGIRHVINQLSIRGSYGYTGNIDRTAYPFSTIRMTSTEYVGERYAKSFTYPNPSVKWEEKSSLNFGVNFGLLDNALSVGSNYYFNRTEDILTNLKVASSTGRNKSKYNGGIVTNEGIELTVNIRWINRKNVSFYTSANIARNKNIIEESYYGVNNIWEAAAKSNGSRGGRINILGKETGSIYGWKFAGVYASNGNPMIYLSDEAKFIYGQILDKWESYSSKMQKKAQAEGWAPITNGIPDAVAIERLLYSDSKTVDMDMQTLFKNLMTASMVRLGRSNPKYVGGFSTSLRVKRWTLKTYWSYKLGHIIHQFDDRKNAPKTTKDGERATFSSDIQVSNTNREKEFLYRWRNSGDNTSIYSFTTERDNLSSVHTSSDYQKGDYLRLRSASLSYRAPQSFAKKIGFENLSLTLNGNNLLTFTEFQGLDVATRNSFAYPQARRVTMRLSFGF
ncbi:MAG: SusC/RagA family TonB-linked outer membrane protein [Carboxylicivirga sp.]|jgi:TonB-linked SusC/RagA family outer membrane protein|nr:SusC/RagA family TonB-linked outer membrane protein [Carboxylicivirga sp.]